MVTATPYTDTPATLDWLMAVQYVKPKGEGAEESGTQPHRTSDSCLYIAKADLGCTFHEIDEMLEFLCINSAENLALSITRWGDYTMNNSWRFSSSIRKQHLGSVFSLQNSGRSLISFIPFK